MVEADDILSVQARRGLYEFVRRNPGHHLREIARLQNLSTTLAEYHLRFLEKHELISSAMDGEYKRYFPRYLVGDREEIPALTDRQKVILGYLRQPIPLAVLMFLMEHESGMHKEILARTTVGPSTLSHHLKKLLDAEVIARVTAGEGYRVVDPKGIARLMVTYELAGPDQVDAFVRLWGEFRP